MGECHAKGAHRVISAMMILGSIILPAWRHLAPVHAHRHGVGCRHGNHAPRHRGVRHGSGHDRKHERDHGQDQANDLNACLALEETAPLHGGHSLQDRLCKTTTPTYLLP